DPRRLWRVRVGRAVRGTPAIGETILAVGGTDRTVTLLERASGEQVWSRGLKGTIHAGPLLDGDRLYVGTQQTPEGRVYALRLADGKAAWSVATGGVEAPLALTGDAVFAGTETGTIYRLARADGRTVWRRQLAGALRAGPVPTADGVAVATTSDTVYLLDLATGTVRARRATPGTVLGTPATDGRRLYLATTGGHLLALALPALDVQWDVPAGDAVYGAPALVGDTLYALTRTGALWLVPVDAPAEARRHALDVVSVAGPTPTRSGVLIGGVNGEVLLVDRESGVVRWRTLVDGPVESPPLVRDRQLVVVGGRGDIHAYR
ncbi:MAG: PQQ-binding-like beta-propeller repeat protein, partial [Gemmatimonadales bacterium]